MWFADFYL